MVGWKKIVVVAMALAACGSLARAQSPDRCRVLSNLGQWVKFRVVLGRVTLVSTQSGKQQDFETIDPSTGVHERAAINVTGEVKTFRFERNTPDQRMVIEFLGADHLTIEREPLGASSVVPLRYLQRPDQRKVQLVLGTEPHQQVIAAEGLWHLLLAWPEPAREQLAPILQQLRPGWQLVETAERVDAGLIRLAGTGGTPERPHWEELVRQLGHPRFSQRAAAQRELLAGGPAVIGFLRRLDQRTLDAEQRAGVERVMSILAPEADDTAERVTLWTVDDPSIWYALLAHRELTHRQAAAQQLVRLLGRHIDFDPQATEEARRQQLSRLLR